MGASKGHVGEDLQNLARAGCDFERAVHNVHFDRVGLWNQGGSRHAIGPHPIHIEFHGAPALQTHCFWVAASVGKAWGVDDDCFTAGKVPGAAVLMIQVDRSSERECIETGRRADGDVARTAILGEGDSKVRRSIAGDIDITIIICPSDCDGAAAEITEYGEVGDCRGNTGIVRIPIVGSGPCGVCISGPGPSLSVQGCGNQQGQSEGEEGSGPCSG